MYFLMALIAHIFGSCSPFPYETEDNKGKCCICKKEIKEDEQ